jgi:hypothetical protein
MGCNVGGGGGVDSALTPGFNLLVPRQKGRSACSRSRGITSNCCETPRLKTERPFVICLCCINQHENKK